MSEHYGNQAIGCNVSSCSYFKDNRCTLEGIRVSYNQNVTSGIAAEETLCMSYRRRDTKRQDRAEHIDRFGLDQIH